MSSESARVLEAAKQAIHARGLTYRALGDRLGMSESGVKKLFASGNCSLAKLVEVCDAIGCTLEDLAHLARQTLGAPATLTPAQEAFFAANPQCFYFLWELLTNAFDLAAVTRAHGIGDRARRVYLTALAAQGCIEVRRDGRVRGVGGFAVGIRLGGELSQRVFHAQQDALLACARASVKTTGDPASLASLGMMRVRLRRETVHELKRAEEERRDELARLARRDALLAPDDRIEVGLMSVLAPFELARAVSLAVPRIRAARTRRPRGSRSPRASARTPR